MMNILEMKIFLFELNVMKKESISIMWIKKERTGRMKNKVVHIRLDEKTYNIVVADSKRTDKNISAYIRGLILSTTVGTDPEIKRAMNDLRREINKIGVNINQIAKNTNAGSYSDTERIFLIQRQDMLLSEFRAMEKRIRRAL